MLGMPERQVEEHLTHVVKTILRDKTRQFILDPARCQDCDFVFRDRSRLTSPSRCPHCRSEAIAPPRRSEAIAPPRYGINLTVSS
jgi:predicted Zn-ribbon and HTH transcriptional regulator